MKLNPIHLPSNRHTDVESALQDLRNDIERKLDQLDKKIRRGGTGDVARVDTRLIRGDPGPPGSPGVGLPGPPGPPGSLDAFTGHLLPATDCQQNIGSALLRIFKLYICDQTIEFETGSLSVKESQDRPGERGLFFKDNDSGHPEVEIIPSRPTLLRERSQLVFLGDGEYQTPEEFLPESIEVWRHGIRLAKEGLNRIDVTGNDKFKFNLTGRVHSLTDVSCSYVAS